MLIARSPRDPYRLLQVLGYAGFIRVAMCFARARDCWRLEETFAIQALAQKPL